MTYVHNSSYFRLGLITCGRGTGPSQGRLGPRPEPLQKSQVSRTVRGVTSAKTADVTPPSRPMLSVPTSSRLNLAKTGRIAI